MGYRYAVCLRPAEQAMPAARSAPAHAGVLLRADRRTDDFAWSDARMAEAVEDRGASVGRVRRRWMEGGLDDVSHHPPADRLQQKLNGTQKARLMAVACSMLPSARAPRRLRLLGDKPGELEVVDRIAVGTVLTYTSSSPG